MGGALPWVVASLVGVRTRRRRGGVDAFGVRAEPGLGTLGPSPGWAASERRCGAGQSERGWASVATIAFMVIVAIGVVELWRHQRDSRVWKVFAGCAVVALIAVAGPGESVLTWLVEEIPGAGCCATPISMVALAVLFYAIAAGAAISAVKRWVPAGFRRCRRPVAGRRTTARPRLGSGRFDPHRRTARPRSGRRHRSSHPITEWWRSIRRARFGGIRSPAQPHSTHSPDAARTGRRRRCADRRRYRRRRPVRPGCRRRRRARRGRRPRQAGRAGSRMGGRRRRDLPAELGKPHPAMQHDDLTVYRIPGDIAATGASGIVRTAAWPLNCSGLPRFAGMVFAAQRAAKPSAVDDQE